MLFFPPDCYLKITESTCEKFSVPPSSHLSSEVSFFCLPSQLFPPHKFWKYLFRSFSDDAAGIKHKPKIWLSLTFSKLLTASVFFFLRWPVWRGDWPLSPWFWSLSAWLQVPSCWPRLQVGNSYIWRDHWKTLCESDSELTMLKLAFYDTSESIFREKNVILHWKFVCLDFLYSINL